MKYRKKPIIIDAIQWFKMSDHPQVTPFETELQGYGQGYGWIKTLEGGYIVTPGDWIIEGVKGEFYPCKPDIFKKTYELIENKEWRVSNPSELPTCTNLKEGMVKKEE